LFGAGTHSIDVSRQEYVETASSPREYFDLFKYTFGPMVAIHRALSSEPGRSRQLDKAFLQFISRWNRDTDGGVRIPYEYLLAVARKRSSVASTYKIRRSHRLEDSIQ
jgi:hypothetical protein